MYRRLSQIQGELMTMAIPKSGYNKFGRYEYYELEDILPVIWRKCYEHHITLVFNFIEDNAILRLKDWDNPGEEISVRVPMPPITSLNKGMNILQSEGSYLTYLKRYLLVNTFLIMEKDIADADITDGVSDEGLVTSTPSTIPEDKPELNEESLRYLRNISKLTRKHNDGELTAEGFGSEAESYQKKGLINRSQKEFLVNYFENWGVPDAAN